MARIPDEEIERLNDEVSVERLAEARGVALHRHGTDLLGLCPFHDDHEPSLVISQTKNLWHYLVSLARVGAHAGVNCNPSQASASSSVAATSMGYPCRQLNAKSSTRAWSHARRCRLPGLWDHPVATT